MPKNIATPIIIEGSKSDHMAFKHEQPTVKMAARLGHQQIQLVSLSVLISKNILMA